MEMKTLKNKQKFISILSVIMLLFVFTSCEEENAGGLTAVAGSDREADVGSSVTLDGSASMDLTGTGFNTLWSFVSVPEGSTAVIENASSNVASFVPDAQGDYIVDLTISNNLGESSDQVVITALAATVSISGSYNEDLHLTNIFDDPATVDYVISGDVNINERLTIDQGVRIAVLNDRRLRIRNSGVIEINGTEQEPVIMEGDSPLAGFWIGMTVESNNLENTINHLHISHTGSSDILSGRPKTALHIENARINIQNSHFTDNEGFGFSARGENNMPMSNCFFENNGEGAMHIHPTNITYLDEQTNFNNELVHITSGSLSENTDHTWKKLLNGSYFFRDDVQSYGNITIEAGAELVFDNSVSFRNRNSSVLEVNGTETDKVIFRGSIEQPGAWQGITIESNSLLNSIHHAQFMHTGHSTVLPGYDKASVALASNARLEIADTHFSDLDGYGIYVRYDNSLLTTSQLSFGQNISIATIRLLAIHLEGIDETSDFNNYYIEVHGGNLNTGNNYTWINPTNGKYLFTNDVQIYDRLVINPGVTMEFENDLYFRVRAEGTVIAEGTSSEKITFTRKENSGSHWLGIHHGGTSVENVLDHVIISYGGNSAFFSSMGQTNLGLDNNARLTLTNSTISNSLGTGIVVRGSAELTESGNTFSGNAGEDIVYQ